MTVPSVKLRTMKLVLLLLLAVCSTWIYPLAADELPMPEIPVRIQSIKLALLGETKPPSEYITGDRVVSLFDARF